MAPASGSWFDHTVHVGDLVAAAAAAAAIIVGVVSLGKVRKTIEQANMAAKSAHYSELDRFYAELLRTAIEMPYLRTPARPTRDQLEMKADYESFPRDSDEYKRYDTYALMVWNFIETIRDRCHELHLCGDAKNCLALKNTWKPIIDAENEIHRGWFLAELRREHLLRVKHGTRHVECDKFCLGFRNFVRDRQWCEDDWEYRENYSAPFSTEARPVDSKPTCG